MSSTPLGESSLTRLAHPREEQFSLRSDRYSVAKAKTPIACPRLSSAFAPYVSVGNIKFDCIIYNNLTHDV